MESPESVELLENNKGSVFSLELGEKIIDLHEDKILTFWDRVEELDVWEWKKEYMPKDEILDGHHWELKLRNRKGMSKYVYGHMSYPNKYTDLMKELNKLFGSKMEVEV